MNNNVSNKKFVTEYTCDGAEYKLRVDYGLNSCGGQEPYFSITSQLYVRSKRTWELVSCGCQHELVRQHAKKLIPLLKWHLCSYNSGPMHYMANGLFWLKRAQMTEDVPMFKGDSCAIGSQALDNFKSTIIYGTAKMDSFYLDKLSNLDYADIQGWLRDRLPEVMKKFHRVLKAQGLDVPKSQATISEDRS